MVPKILNFWLKNLKNNVPSLVPRIIKILIIIVDKILLLLLIECTLIVNFFNIMVIKWAGNGKLLVGKWALIGN